MTVCVCVCVWGGGGGGGGGGGADIVALQKWMVCKYLKLLSLSMVGYVIQIWIGR